jgi:hypothetical protein
MSVPGGMMESLAMLQSALTAATPEVTMPEVVGTVQNPMQMAGMSSAMGGSGSARAGAAAADLLGGMAQPRRGRGGGIAPTKNELELALLGGNLPTTPEQYEARDQYVEAAAQYENSRTSRFGRTNLGKMESLYDLFRGKGARKDMVEARNNLHQVNEARAIEHQQSMVAKEMERREKYVNDVRPLLAYTNPNLPHQALEGLAVQAAAQNMPIEKLLPEGAPQPVAEEYAGPSGETMVRFRNPVNGAIMTSENYKPYVKEGPSDKTTGQKNTTALTYDEEGVEYRTTYGPPDDSGVLPIVAQMPTGKNMNTKPFVEMSPETRKYAGMVGNISSNVAQALPHMFSPEGNWRSVATQEPNSRAKAEYENYRTAIIQSIRPESGAAVPPEEQETAFRNYLPLPTDGDVTAQMKVQKFAKYQQRMHDVFFQGYTGVPETLNYVPFEQPWMSTPAGQEAAMLLEIQEADDAARQAELDARMAEWEAQQAGQ